MKNTHTIRPHLPASTIQETAFDNNLHNKELKEEEEEERNNFSKRRFIQKINPVCSLILLDYAHFFPQGFHNVMLVGALSPVNHRGLYQG